MSAFDPKRRPRIGIFVLGLGDQGQRALNHIAHICGSHLKELDSIFLGCFDPVREKIDAAYDKHPDLINPLNMAKDQSDIESMLSYSWELYERRLLDAVLVYDASKTDKHFLHFSRIDLFQDRLRLTGRLLGRFYFYFGEKPLAVPLSNSIGSPISVSSLDHKHYCNFIETLNPAVIAAKKELFKLSGIVSSIDIFRINSVALERYVRNTRTGVTGGAFLDKTSHDIPVCLELTGGNDLLIESVAAAQYLPFDINTSHEPHAFGLGLAGEASEVTDAIFAEGTSEIVLRVGGMSGTRCRLVAGWLGPTEEHLNEIGAIADLFSVPMQSLVAERVVAPKGFTPGYIERDVRVCRLQGYDRSGGKFEILINMLRRDSASGWRHEIVPCCLIKERGQGLLRRRRLANNDALRAAFLSVLKDINQEIRARRGRRPVQLRTISGLNHEISAKAHRILFAARSLLDDKFVSRKRQASNGYDIFMDSRKLIRSSVIFPTFTMLSLEKTHD